MWVLWCITSLIVLCIFFLLSQGEIEELEKKLASLKSEEAALCKEIHHQEDLITAAKEEFADEIHALEDERSKVNGKDAEVKLKEEKLNRIRDEISSKLAGSQAEVRR